MKNFSTEKLNLTQRDRKKLDRFKDYAVSHSVLARIDRELMRAIREPAGFANVLLYGPSGVGKTTMIRQITQRLNRITSSRNTLPSVAANGDNLSALPLLLLETRPPDGGAFNRADYYRTALKLLGEPFYERRVLVNIDSEQTWEKKGRSKTKAAQFNDSPELRNALEDALSRRRVQAVILDEAQHLMKLGNGSSAGKLIDQLDWIKSMTNVTGVLHVLIGTYELLSFRNLSGQASRRGLDLHFPRYKFQSESDQRDFQGVLLALLKQVPISVEIEALMQHWVYFYERSIGCVGVLKDWLIRALAAALYDKSKTLTLEYLQDHALSLAQCERMAIDAIEGEQQLSLSESRHQQLWLLLNRDGNSSIHPTERDKTSLSQLSTTLTNGESFPKQPKNSTHIDEPDVAAIKEDVIIEKPIAKKRGRPKKSQAKVKSTSSSSSETDPTAIPEPSQKKTNRRVGQRKPKRDPTA